jgi:hypothetical protein
LLTSFPIIVSEKQTTCFRDPMDADIIDGIEIIPVTDFLQGAN